MTTESESLPRLPRLNPVFHRRLSLNMNREDVAREAGVSDPTLAKAERGEPISLRKAFAIAKALGMAGREWKLFPDLIPEPAQEAAL